MNIGAPGAEPAQFLKLLRRRYLTTAFLALCLPAALLNEAYRWTAYGTDRLFGFAIPYLNTGPYFLLAAFAYALRRWSLSHTASFADQRLSFRDRLTSFIDFSRRDDLPQGVRNAQSSEVSRSLDTVTAGSLAPLGIRHVLGPVLLTASLMYPLLFFSSSKPPPFLGPSGIQGPGGSGGIAENLPDIPASPLDLEPGDAGPTENADGIEAVEDNPADARGNAGGLDVKDSEKDGSGNDPLDSEASRPAGRTAENPFESDGNELEAIVSKRTGLQLSNVVDPVFADSTESSQQDSALPGGSMSFRLIPKTEPGDETGSSSAMAVVPPMKIDIDFKNIPERYREIVRRYFTDLERITTKGSS